MRELAEFALRQKPNDLVLLAYEGDQWMASLILDLNDPTSSEGSAHLRWFITKDSCRGTGLGRIFMQRAVDHAKVHCNGKIWLTTFAGLHPARHLYESFGFKLTHETEGQAWGTVVTEQEFRRS